MIKHTAFAQAGFDRHSINRQMPGPFSLSYIHRRSNDPVFCCYVGHFRIQLAVVDYTV